MKTKQQQRTKWEQIIFFLSMVVGFFQFGYGFTISNIYLIAGGFLIAFTSIGLLATSTPNK